MESKTRNQPSLHYSQININEEELDKKSKDTQNKPNSQSLISQKSLSNANSAAKRATTKIPLLNQENLIFNSRAYQNYIKTYQKFTSFYIIESEMKTYKKKLTIYNIKNKREESKFIRENYAKIDQGTCYAKLPNGGLFFFGCFQPRIGMTAWMDRDFYTHKLPSGKYCWNSSAIYYNKSVYCFGGNNSSSSGNNFFFSYRFDFDKNCWISLAPIPETAENCTTAIFNGNILISKNENHNLWHYSIDIDSFSIIPYKFLKLWKVMTNAGERLYLIQSTDYDWFIYESEVRDEFSWKLISKKINYDYGKAHSSIYDKENEIIYILSTKDKIDFNAEACYYKFNLNDRAIEKISKCSIF